MQKGAQNHASAGRLLGFVRVVIGGRVFQLPVQAMSFDDDTERTGGGFFEHEGELGIIVDEAAAKPAVQAQIDQATAQAVRHLSQKYLS